VRPVEVKKDEKELKKDAAPFWQVTALATANVPLALNGSDFLFGFRGEVDVWRISALVSLDRRGMTPFSMSDIQTWNGLLGASVVATKSFRLRALGGVGVLATESTATFAPTLGTTARVGWKWIALEGALHASAGAFRQLDARAELVLHGGVVELHAGYRVRLIDPTPGGSVETLFATAPVSGPCVALGLSF
jgi:hypothetical protein